MSLPAELQVVLPKLQDIQNFPYQVWNCDNIGFDPNGKCNKMVCTYKFFTGDRLWRTQTGKRAPFWRTMIIFTRADVQCLLPPVVVQKSTKYTQYLYYNITCDRAIHNFPSVYMNRDGWHKYMSHFASMC